MASTIDHSTCNVIYVDRRAKEDRLVQRAEVTPSTATDSIGSSYFDVGVETAEVAANLQALLTTFQQVHLCASGASCRATAAEIDQQPNSDLNPTLVLIEIPPNDEPGGAVPNGTTSSDFDSRHDFPTSPEVEDRSFYGVRLLRCIAVETHWQSLSRLFVPIAVVFDRGQLSAKASGTGYAASGSMTHESDGTGRSSRTATSSLDTGHMLRYLDAGAADVVTTPFSRERIAGLVTHAYRAHKEAVKEQKDFLAVKRVRKRSWVGVDDAKPYAYLREAMVSGLMDGICKPQPVGDGREQPLLSIRRERHDRIALAIGQWAFPAHEYSDDELLHAALLMLQHALSMHDLEPWRLTTEHLTAFLIATRTAYNSFVPYHNFRHVVDVLQAVFYFLLQLGSLPPYPPHPPAKHSSSTCHIASILRPFDALTLLITAIGHDVGHPGVNNAFLVTLNAPLAQLYNDRSVLESFHCAAFSQILRRYWPASFESADMRRMLINSILATDMGLHFDYMRKLAQLQETLRAPATKEAPNDRYLEEQRTLACSLLIKCADISNVARPHNIAAQWATVLTDEFARQAAMENDLGIPSALFAPPVRDSVLEMGKSQIGFMNLFALPLFQGVTGIMPSMQFSVDELQDNKATWEMKIEREKARSRSRSTDGERLAEAVTSPPPEKLASVVRAPEARPPEIVATPAQYAPYRVPQSPDRSANGSRRSSLNTTHPVASPDRRQASRSSAGSLMYTGQLPDMVSRNSSGALPVTTPPSLRARRSSTTVPTQLQLGISGGEGRRTSGDHSLVAVLVTSSGRSSKPSDGHSTHRANGNSSEKSSAPSSTEWQSQVTSPVNVTCSPTTEGTSFLGQDSPDRADFDTTLWSPPPDDRSERSDKAGYTNGTAHDTSKGVRHRSSRWRLNFWKSKRKTSMEALRP